MDKGLLIVDRVVLVFTIGNRYELKDEKTCPKNGGGRPLCHFWTAFAQFKDNAALGLKKTDMSKLVSRITFELHDSYKGRNPDLVQRYDVKPGEYEKSLSKHAWGYFDVPCVVYFHKGTGLKPLYVEFELCFRTHGLSDGRSKDYIVNASMSKLTKFLNGGKSAPEKKESSA